MAIEQITAVAGRGVLRPDELVLDADDLGVTRGDGCFDATRVCTDDRGRSTVDHLDEHVARMNRSITGLGDEPSDPAAWRQLVDDALAAWSTPGEAVLKLMYSRGAESTPTGPVLFLTITRMSAGALAQRDGIRVVRLARGYASDAFADAPWLLGGVKTLSYAVNMAAKREAARRGADDVVFTSSDGFCLEGPSASLVVWDAARRVLATTPTGATGILDSITQKVVWRAAEAEGVQCEYRLVGVDELEAADGIWLLSSIRGAVPVVELDGAPRENDAEMSRNLRRWSGIGAAGGVTGR